MSQELSRIFKLLQRYFLRLNVWNAQNTLGPQLAGLDVGIDMNRRSTGNEQDVEGRSSLAEKLFGEDFILWGVPTSRRSAERRLTRKNAIEKRLKPKRNILTCNRCGHFYESQTICGNCYSKVREETAAIQDAMEKEWKLGPVDKEVVVVYDNDQDKEYWNGKRIVEMKKERPQWFHKNLLTKMHVTQTSAETSLQVPPPMKHTDDSTEDVLHMLKSTTGMVE